MFYIAWLGVHVVQVQILAPYLSKVDFGIQATFACHNICPNSCSVKCEVIIVDDLEFWDDQKAAVNYCQAEEAGVAWSCVVLKSDLFCFADDVVPTIAHSRVGFLKTNNVVFAGLFFEEKFDSFFFVLSFGEGNPPS